MHTPASPRKPRQAHSHLGASASAEAATGEPTPNPRTVAALAVTCFSGWLWALLWKEAVEHVSLSQTTYPPPCSFRFHHLECVPRRLSVSYVVYCYILSGRKCWCVVGAQ